MKLILTDTARPLRLEYDGSKYADFVVGSNGGLSILPNRGAADGFDNAELFLAGGGSASDSRGAALHLYGNERGGGADGLVDLLAGNVAGAHIRLWAGGAIRMYVTNGGQVLIGTAVNGTSVAGEVVVGHGKRIHWVNSGGSGLENSIKSESGQLRLETLTGGLILEGRNVGLDSVSFGGGQRIFSFENTITAPTSNHPNGGLLYVEAGVLKYRGQGGTITTIAPS